MLKQTLALVGLTLSLTANAASVIYSEEKVVTAIGSLVIGDWTYNVDFNEAGGYDTYGGEIDFFNGDDDAALEALGAINAALTAAGAGPDVEFNSEGDGNNPSAIYVIYNQYGTGSLGGIYGASGWEPTTIESDDQNLVAFSEVSEVPIPAAAWLFGSALIGLAGFKRRQ